MLNKYYLASGKQSSEEETLLVVIGEGLSRSQDGGHDVEVAY